MKRILRIDEFISAIRKETAKSDKPYFVVWADGELIFEPKHDDMIQVRFFVGIHVDPIKKKLTIRPMDDWADQKIIRKVQQAFGDLIRVNAIDKSWTAEIGDATNTKRSLGSMNVGDILSYNADYGHVIPYSFHGTTTHHIDKIMKDGILSRTESKEKPNWKLGYTERSEGQVYLTIDFNRGKYYAQTAVDALKKRGIDAKPVVIRLKDVPTTDIVVDDDYNSNMSMLNLLQAVHTGKKANKESYIQGIRNSGQFAVKNKVDPKYIEKVYKR